jgi:hypothetical protein
MRHMMYILGITLGLISAGCSKSNSGSSGSSGFTGNPNVPPVTTPSTSTTNTSSATIALTLSDKSALDQYVGWTTNVPTDTSIAISLSKQGTYAKTGGGYDYSFGGKVTIKFKDGTASYSDDFSSLMIASYNTIGSNVENNKYNLLSSDYPGLNGAVGFHGFFEDSRVQRLVPPMPYSPIFGGAVILVIDQTNDSGDGQGPTLASGSIWFKNYLGQYPMGPLPNTNCWFISAGPYDCRAWPAGSGVNTKAAIYPDNGYVKLGSFTGLDIKNAFNNQI